MKKEDFERSNINKDGYCKMDVNNKMNKLCVRIADLNKNFAKYGGYNSFNNWSEQHVGKNTCVNTGTYSLFKTNQFNGKTRGSENDLVCGAISDDIFLKENIDNWKHGERGKKEKKHIIHGIESLMKQCYDQGTETQRKGLKNRVCNFIESTKYLEGIFYNSPIKLKYCSADGDKL